MTPDQLTALAARLRDHAAMHDSVVPNDDELRQWRDDLIAAAKYLRQCAEAEPTIDINIKIAVPENWSNRLDMQWIVEREIHADRWSWSYAAPQAMNTQADAIEALRDLLPLAEAFTRKAVFTAQRAGELASILDRARRLAAQGGNDE